jgi:hypothetical protein
VKKIYLQRSPTYVVIDVEIELCYPMIQQMDGYSCSGVKEHMCALAAVNSHENGQPLELSAVRRTTNTP